MPITISGSGLITTANATFSGTLGSASRGITASSVPTGSVIQVVQTVLSSTVTITSNAVEQQLTGLSTSITPTSATSKILIILNLNYCSLLTTYAGYFKRSGTVIGIGDAGASQQRVGFGLALASDLNQVNSFYYQYLDSPATTTALTYTLWLINDNTYSIYVNRSQNDSNSVTGKRTISSVTLLEVAV